MFSLIIFDVANLINGLRNISRAADNVDEIVDSVDDLIDNADEIVDNVDEVVDIVDGLALDDIAEATLDSGLRIRSITRTADDIVDAAGRPALGHTSRVGSTLDIRIAAGQSAAEESITVYHEVLEGAMGAHFDRVPMSLQDINEGGIDVLANSAHEQFGTASVANLNRFLEQLGF